MMKGGWFQAIPKLKAKRTPGQSQGVECQRGLSSRVSWEIETKKTSNPNLYGIAWACNVFEVCSFTPAEA